MEPVAIGEDRISVELDARGFRRLSRLAGWLTAMLSDPRPGLPASDRVLLKDALETLNSALPH